MTDHLPLTVTHRPHCGVPVRVVALLTTAEAARPTTPTAARWSDPDPSSNQLSASNDPAKLTNPCGGLR
jgi:hypothetical protein